MPNDLIINILKEIIKLQDLVKTGDICYKSKRRKTYNFTKYSLLVVFKEIYMSCIHQ